ncbi:ataxin-10, partial [Aplysia californica]|uniref:Ataxin-10 n=1 Tax=Aplysia californica TaxID=6500 RepID=A0ABM0JY15_APLCA
MDGIQPLLESCVHSSSINNWVDVKDSLRNVLAKESDFKSVVVGPFLQSLNEVLKSLAEKLGSDSEDSKVLQGCAAESFRCLRQACALNSDVQSGLSSCPDLLENTKLIIEKVHSLDSKSDSENVLKCSAQFLGNTCASNTENQKLIWDMFIQQLRLLVHHPDSKVCDYTCMLVHTCLSSLGRTDQSLLTDPLAQDVVLFCIQATAQQDVEWGLYVLEDMLRNDLFLSTLYAKMGHKERVLLLEVMLAEMSEIPGGTEDGTSGQQDGRPDGGQSEESGDGGGGGG